MGIMDNQKIITELLIKYPHLRDDDNKLIANIWIKEFDKDMQYRYGEDFLGILKALLDQRLTSPTAISNCRKKVQKLDANLLGNRKLLYSIPTGKRFHRSCDQ